MSDYHPEPYWSQVAAEIGAREGVNVIAGDDEPYYVYKRIKFLKLLLELDLAGKHVLEIGPGPGGNLLELSKKQTGRLVGADISAEMIKIARSRLPDHVELVKTNGTKLPFEDSTFDIVFSATVLQHNSDDAMMRKLAGEMARVSGDQVYLFEQVNSKISGDHLMRARPVPYYASIMAEHGFELAETKMIDIVPSYYVCGAIRKGLNPRSRKEGEPLTSFSLLMQRLTLPITKVLDGVITPQKDLARMRFVRKKSA